MSGTSLDGIDGVVVDFAAAARRAPTSLAPRPARASRPACAPNSRRSTAPATTKSTAPRSPPTRSHATTRRWSRPLLRSAAVGRDRAIVAIGCHGQTVRHRPGEFDGIGYTVQLNAPALLAELTGIDVIADFRSRDVAAGGQGAPLVPAFHRAIFGRADATVAVLNLGGIANLTVLGPRRQRRSASTAARRTPCSTSGANARPGGLRRRRRRRRHAALSTPRLLDALLAEPYFALAPPKSTGRDLFNAPGSMPASTRPMRAPGCARRTSRRRSPSSPRDVVAAACRRHAAGADELVVCGGGALNADLMRAAAVDRSRRWRSSRATRAGCRADQVEATAFAWLARAFVERRPATCRRSTGAAGPRVLGALYPAR